MKFPFRSVRWQNGIRTVILNSFSRRVPRMQSIFFILVVGAIFTAIAQPIPKTSWTSINERALGFSNVSYPRVASFSNGDFVVVYPVYVGGNQYSQMGAKIFDKNGSVKVKEFILSDSIGPHYGPTVMVTKGDIGVAVWRSLTGPQMAIFQGIRFLSDGTKLNSSFFVLDTNNNAPKNMYDVLGLFSLNSSQIFGCTFPPVNANNTAKLSFNSISTTNNTEFDLISYDIPVAVYDDRTNKSFYMLKNAIGAYDIVSYWGYKPLAKELRRIANLTTTATYAVPVLIDSTSLVPFLQVTNNAIYFGRFQQDFNGIFFQPLFTNNVKENKLPSAVHLGSDYVLTAHSSTLNSVIYKYGKVSLSDGYTQIGPELSLNDAATIGVHMARIGNSSDVIVTALNAARNQVLIRRMTFCGNGVLDMNEQCDGSDDCTSQCTCLPTLEYRNGACADVCGNGVVTGSEECDSGLGCNNATCKCMPGYQPYVNKQDCQPIPPQFIPSVGPSLDCLNIIDSNSMTLYFSFVNNNGFDLNIPYGLLNNFVPTNLANDRPTFFTAGNSLTYPVSPYNVTIPHSTEQVTWLLGSYNLTIDLSGNKAEALQCPKDAGFVITIATLDTLNKTDIQTILNNLADRYNFSASRLDATYRLSIAGNETQPNIYSISITILSSPNATEKSVQDILSAMFSEINNAKQEFNSDLTQGLNEKNPLIKDVTASPTGVEVRGQQRDIPPSAVEPISQVVATSHAQLLQLNSAVFLAAISTIFFFMFE